MLPIFLLFLIFSLSSCQCPEKSISWQSRCYYFDTTEIPFVTAEESCIQLGGHLASIHDGFTNAFLAHNSNYDFKNWGKLDNVTGQDCAGINAINGLWQSEDCFKPKPYICQVPPKIITTTTKKPTQCPAGWVYYSISRSCYGNLGISTWPEAERTCNSVNAHLISIHTIEENNFVQNLEHKAGHWLWIGGNVTYRNGEADVRWTDGTPYDFSWFKNMHTGNSQCLNFGDRKFSERWYTDTDCNSNQPYYCKKPAAF